MDNEPRRDADKWVCSASVNQRSNYAPRGQRLRLLHEVEQAIECLETEHRVYNAAIKYHKKYEQKFDLVELCADEANVTQRADVWGLRAGQPVGLRYGWEIKKNDRDLLNDVCGDPAAKQGTMCVW